MKPVSEIKFGFSDAENYRRRENKDLFNRIFLKNDALDAICQRNTFFLIGEKGTGKTAYAVYLSNSPYRGNKSLHRFIRETDYQKFISLRRENRLTLSDYTDIWRIIIYMLLADAIYDSNTKSGFGFTSPRLKSLKDAVDEYYDNAFSSEIPVALQFVEDSKRAAEIVAKHVPLTARLGSETQSRSTIAGDRFQTNLLYLKREFEDALAAVRLTDNHILFIDGVDIRPSSVPYNEYLDCVKGLANAVWSINNDFFPSVRDSQGRLRAVLLLRPDIFNSLGLQNRNTKLKDNSVVLNWNTNYTTHRSSDLFRLADRMFSAQQDTPQPIGRCWDHYFPFDATNVLDQHGYHTSFILFLRYSFHRPRDILTLLDFLRDAYVVTTDTGAVFKYEDLFAPDFRRRYGEYLLGEIKDSLSFYYDDAEYDLFLKFFEYLEGASRFSYDKFLEAFDQFTTYLQAEGTRRASFMRSAEEFLQFLYDQNILCYLEQTNDERFIRWCFLERSPSNISPKIKLDVDYEIHYGLANVLNTGKPFKRRKVRPQSSKNTKAAQFSVGKIKIYQADRKSGFIVQEGLPVDIYFGFEAVLGSPKLKKGQAVKYVLKKGDRGRLIATNISVTE